MPSTQPHDSSADKTPHSQRSGPSSGGANGGFPPPSAVLPTRDLGPSTTAVHAGEARLKFGFSITDPIFAASTYTFSDTQSIVDFIEQKHPREEYGRYGNPGEKVVELSLIHI